MGGCPGMTLVQRGHIPPPEPGAPGIFAMADPARIRALVSEAGFGEPEVHEIAFEFRYADFDDLLDTSESRRTAVAGGHRAPRR